MTPNARFAAAIEILDAIVGGDPAEQALTGWGRAHRFAGSKDRAAIRDICFDILRQRQECSVLGGGLTGRALVLGYLRKTGVDPQTVFTAEKFAPAVLTETEVNVSDVHVRPSDQMNLPEWMHKFVSGSLQDEFIFQNQRADLFLRVNLRKASLEKAQKVLEVDGISTAKVPEISTCLHVTEGQRKVQKSQAYLTGQVEIQDAGSQAVVHALQFPNEASAKILDYCAGGGGKSLAMAAISDAKIDAFDISAKRMSDISARAKRAGVVINQLSQQPSKVGYDYILADVPCSGSGAWARNPDGKWKLSEAAFSELLATQQNILTQIAKNSEPNTIIGYVTCSLFEKENEDQISAFLENNLDWERISVGRFFPSQGFGGYFYSELKQKSF